MSTRYVWDKYDRDRNYFDSVISMSSTDYSGYIQYQMASQASLGYPYAYKISSVDTLPGGEFSVNQETGNYNVSGLESVAYLSRPEYSIDSEEDVENAKSIWGLINGSPYFSFDVGGEDINELFETEKYTDVKVGLTFKGTSNYLHVFFLPINK